MVPSFTVTCNRMCITISINLYYPIVLLHMFILCLFLWYYVDFWSGSESVYMFSLSFVYIYIVVREPTTCSWNPINRFNTFCTYPKLGSRFSSAYVMILRLISNISKPVSFDKYCLWQIRSFFLNISPIIYTKL